MPKFSKAYLEATYELAYVVLDPGQEPPDNIADCVTFPVPIPIRGNEIDANGNLIPIWPFELEGDDICQPT